MPPLSPTMALLTDRVVFLTLGTLGHALYLCFLAAIFLGVGRMIFLVVASLWRRRRAKRGFRRLRPQTEPVPCLGDRARLQRGEPSIARTVHGILAGTLSQSRCHRRR